MGYPALHRPHAISMPTTGGTAILTQFTSFAVNKAYNVYRARAASAPIPQWSGVDEGNPEIQFGSPDLKAILDHCNCAMSEQGLVVGYDPVVNTGTVAMYYRKGKNRGLREAIAATVHDRWDLVNNAMFYWRSLQAQAGRGSRAVIECSLRAISNDGANPLTYVGSTALEGTEAITHLYTLGPIKLNTVLINSVASLRIDNGIQTREFGADGLPFPQYGDIESSEPTATIETADLTLESTYGSPVALTSFAFYLRALKKDGLPYADNEAQHIKISGTAGMAVLNQVSSMPGQVSLQLAIDKVNDATAPFTVNTACAIT
jgi:hypothetical protein